MHFDDGHGGEGPDVVGVEDAEQSLGDFGELVVDFEVDAGGEEGEGFEEALDVGIVAFVGFEDEAAGDFGVFLGEFGAKLAEVVEFVFVVEEEFVTHGIGSGRRLKPSLRAEAHATTHGVYTLAFSPELVFAVG
jgi:hypothetical protein